MVWTRPPPDRTYGILRRFEIRFFIPSRPEDSLEFITDIPAESISYEITSLLEFTNYSIEVSAVTIDNGPFSNPVYVVTDEDSKYNIMPVFYIFTAIQFLGLSLSHQL